MAPKMVIERDDKVKQGIEYILCHFSEIQPYFFPRTIFAGRPAEAKNEEPIEK